MPMPVRSRPTSTDVDELLADFGQDSPSLGQAWPMLRGQTRQRRRDLDPIRPTTTSSGPAPIFRLMLSTIHRSGLLGVLDSQGGPKSTPLNCPTSAHNHIVSNVGGPRLLRVLQDASQSRFGTAQAEVSGGHSLVCTLATHAVSESALARLRTISGKFGRMCRQFGQMWWAC